MSSLYRTQSLYGLLLTFDVFCGVAASYQEFSHAVALITLQHNQTCFRCSAASAKSLEFMCHVCEVSGLFVHTVNDGGGSAEFPRFQTDANSLLFFFYFATNTQIFRESASCTNFSHDCLTLALDKGIYKSFKAFW